MMQAKKNAFTHVMVNVIDFKSRNMMEMEITECRYEKIENLTTMEKEKVIYLKYSKRSTDTPVPHETQ